MKAGGESPAFSCMIGHFCERPFLLGLFRRAATYGGERVTCLGIDDACEVCACAMLAHLLFIYYVHPHVQKSEVVSQLPTWLHDLLRERVQQAQQALAVVRVSKIRL